MTTPQHGEQEVESSVPFSQRNLLVFLLPSLVGILTFLIPFPLDGTYNVGMGLMADGIMYLLENYLPTLTVLLFWVSLLLTIYAKLQNPEWAKSGTMHEVLHINEVWLIFRILAAVLATLTLFQFGPEFIISDATGGEMLNILLPVLFAFFLFAAIFLPFLTDYGFMEFIGNLVRTPFRFIFNLPGRSAIDATASWFGSGTVGVLITMRQYEGGFYNRREAAIIATNFSVVSIAFSLVIIRLVELDHLFLQYYGSVIVSCLVAAVVLPRIPPLSFKADTYYEPAGQQIIEDEQYAPGLWRDSLYKAIERAKQAPGPRQLMKNSLSNLADIFLAVLPLVFAIGVLALILAEHTPVFNWLSYPMIPLLTLLQIPEAAAAAPATLIGFADMFIPAVMIAGIESDITRFVIAALSVSQLIFMSEVGALIIKSKIPLNLGELIIIFLLRTIITLPIIALIAHLFVF